MKTILQTGCKLCKSGGIENHIMNLYRKIDRTKFKFVFLVEKEQEAENFSDEILSLGGEIYYYDSNQSKIKQLAQKINILKKIDFSVAHVHVSCGIRAIDGLLIKLIHNKSKLIFHSHSNIGKRPIKYSLLIPIYRFISDKLLACSNVAAQYFFGKNIIKSKKYILFKNAIEPLKFAYSEISRKKIRNLYHIDENTFVLGYVGRLSPEKNVRYHIEVISELNKKGFNTKGVIVGAGTEKDSLLNYAEEKGQSDNVIFTGVSSQIGEFLSAFDALILPSFNEGLGIVLIEAQAASLPCFASDVVPVETNISPLIHYIDVKKSAELTASKIQSYIEQNRIVRPCQTDFIDLNGYNINLSIYELEKIYS